MTANKIYDAVSKAIDTLGLNVNCYSVVPTRVESMPCCCIYESDNYTTTSGITLKTEEKTRISQFTIEIYADRKAGGMTTAKTIADKVNSTMNGNGYYRTMQSFVPNTDVSVLRIVSKYRRLIGEND